MGGALGVSASLGEAGGVWPGAALAKTARRIAVLIRIILAPVFAKRMLPRAASSCIYPCVLPNFDQPSFDQELLL